MEGAIKMSSTENLRVEAMNMALKWQQCVIDKCGLIGKIENIIDNAEKIHEFLVEKNDSNQKCYDEEIGHLGTISNVHEKQIARLELAVQELNEQQRNRLQRILR